MNRWKYALVGLLVGAFAFPLVWNSDPLVIGQTVTVDSTQSPLVVNALADLANLTPTDGQSVIIKTGTEKGLWYYDKDSSAVVDSVAVLTGPGSVGRFLVINNDAGSIAAATAITAAQIDNDVDLEFGVFDADSPRSLTLAELKKTGVQVYNVLQYGADPTGVADSYAAFASALTHAEDAGSVVYAPSGTYKLLSPLVFSSYGASIVGDGYKLLQGGAPTGGTVLAFSGLSEPAIQLVGTNGDRRGAFIARLCIDGTSTCTSHGVAAHYTQRYFSMEDVEIRRFTSAAGLLLGETWINNFSRVYFRANKDGVAVHDNSRYTDFTSDGKSQTFSINFTDCVAEANTHHGIYAGNSGASGWSWKGGTIEGNNSSGLASEIQLDGYCEQVNFSDVYFEWAVDAGENEPLITLGDSDAGGVGGRTSIHFDNCFMFTSRSFSEPVISRSAGVAHSLNVVLTGTRIARSSDGSVAVASVDTGTDEITTSSEHHFSVGQDVTFSGTLPSPLVALRKYYVESVPTSTTLTVSTTRGGSAVNLTTAGSGVTVTSSQFPFYIADSIGSNNVNGIMFDGKWLSSSVASSSYNGDYDAFQNGIVAGRIYADNGFLRVARTEKADYGDYLTGATPSADGKHQIAINNSTPTSITNFTGGAEGQILTVYIHDTGNTTIVHNASLIDIPSGVDVKTQRGDVLDFMFINSAWRMQDTTSAYSSAFTTFASTDATPSVLRVVAAKTANASATTITTFDDGMIGQRLFVLINDANTTIDFTGTTLKGNAGVDWTPTTGDHMTCTFDGTNWYCTISDNTP